VRGQLMKDQRSSRASVARHAQCAEAALGSLQQRALQRNSDCLLVACAVEEAAVHGSGAVSGAAQPATAILLVSLTASALLLLDAGGSVVLGSALHGSASSLCIVL